MKKVIITLSSIIVLIFIILMIFLFNVKDESIDNLEEKPEYEDINTTEKEKNEFSSYSYYKEENLERYQNYKANNSSLDNSDIVTRVNLNLDKEIYTDTVQATNLNTNYVLVNKFNYLGSD